MKRRVRKKLGKVITTITDGMLGTVTDFTLLLLFSVLNVAKPGGKTQYEVLFGPNEVLKWHDELNYQTIKRALYKLTTQGFVRRLKKQNSLELAITNLGKERIGALIPYYREARPWDGHLYLISYDIPSTNNSDRNLLRAYIRKTGGALLQHSLWIHPYNPSSILSEFTKMHGISGTILVSKLGRDGAIGEEKLEDLLRRVYKLDGLADRYDAFLEKFSGKHLVSPVSLLIAYMAVLKDDPQLPFPLLPHDFPGAEAYTLFRFYFPE